MTTFRQTLAILGVIYFAGCAAIPLRAQKSNLIDLDSVAPHRLTAMLGLQVLSGLDVGGTAWTLTAEKPITHYKYAGLQLNFYQEAFGTYNYSFSSSGNTYSRLAGTSFEACLYYKTFMSGRFTGRKGGIYYAPELRLGQMHYQYNLVQPYLRDGAVETQKQFLTSLGLRIGFQKEIGISVLDVGMALGIRQVRKYIDSTNNRISLNWQNYIAPSFALGFSF